MDEMSTDRPGADAFRSFLIRAGIMMEPMATTVAGEDPETAAKNMQISTEVIAIPPVKPPTRACPILTSLDASVPFVIMPPATMKNSW